MERNYNIADKTVRKNLMITTVKYGNTNTYFIKGSVANLLIDTDYAGTLPAFYKALKTQGITVSDIDYVLCTHYHPDHCGLVSSLMSQGVKPVVMESQIDQVHYPDQIFAKQPHLDYVPIDERKALVISFAGSRAFL